MKGADSADDNVDPTDAVLVYNNVNPARGAARWALGSLAAAFLLGAYVIWHGRLDPLGDRRCGRRVCGGVLGGQDARLLPAHRRSR